MIAGLKPLNDKKVCLTAPLSIAREAAHLTAAALGIHRSAGGSDLFGHQGGVGGLALLQRPGHLQRAHQLLKPGGRERVLRRALPAGAALACRPRTAQITRGTHNRTTRPNTRCHRRTSSAAGISISLRRHGGEIKKCDSYMPRPIITMETLKYFGIMEIASAIKFRGHE